MAKLIHQEDLKLSFAKRISRSARCRKWVLLELYRKQTADEQAVGRSKFLNGIGFSAVDAPHLTPLAEKGLSGATLSTADQQELKRRLTKYWQQFVASTIMVQPTVPALIPRKPPGKAGSLRRHAKEKAS